MTRPGGRSACRRWACSARTSPRRRCWLPPATTRWWRRSAATASTSPSPSQIRPALERAVASGTVACVNVMLDPEAPMKAGAMGYAV